MNCESFMDLLDRYIDGELSAQQRSELLDHVAVCDNCAKKLREAELLKQTLANLDGAVAVPLEAQASWRKAIKVEAARKKARKRVRLASGIAAALVVVLGSTYFLNNDKSVSDAPTLTILEADGSNGSAESADLTQYAAWRKIRTNDIQTAYETLQSLSDEYGGTLQTDKDGAYRIELPAEYLEEFLQASSRIGEELDAESGENTGENAVIYVQFVTE